jgi:putative membrane protein
MDVVVLIGYLAGGLVLATLAARRQRVWTPAKLRPELAL